LVIPSLSEPSDLVEIHTSLMVEANSFRLQQPALLSAAVPARSETDPALAIDDPMPGNIYVTGKRSHRIADDTGRTSADNFGNLAVGSYLAGRNVTNNGIYPLVQRDAF
jgi:hypothetical protein